MGVFSFVFCVSAGAYQLLDTQQISLGMDGYLLLDMVNLKNVVGLDSHNSDDHSVYFGIDYSFAFSADLKDSGAKAYIKFERNGPYDYDAPLFVHNTMLTSGGVIERYRGKELLPQVEEYWLDNKIGAGWRMKTGLYPYEVGNSFALNGGYENYSVTLYRESENALWRIYYARPDLVYKIRLGPRIKQEIDQGQKYEPNAANFFATDLKITRGEQTFWPYLGVLADYTSNGKRSNLYAATVNRDLLGTLGLAWQYNGEKLNLAFEAAHNFGYAQSADSEYKDIQHTGFLIYSGLNYILGKFVPGLRFLLCSGNKTTPDMAGSPDALYVSGKNRSFSYFSPTNQNLSDTISSNNVDMLPIVAMSGGSGLNYGVPRPGAFASGDFENLIMPSAGFDYNFTDKLCFSLYAYYLNAYSRPVGTLNGEGKYLSRELGVETDIFLDYKVNDHVTVGVLAGYFIPGRYYKEERDDVDGSIFSPFLRGDGRANNAYQVELYAEFIF